jgi:hypothetical protein
VFVTSTAASGTIAPMTFSAAAHTARMMPGLPVLG